MEGWRIGTSMQNIYPEKAKRVGLVISGDGQSGIAFFRTFTGPNIPLSIEEHLITVAVDKVAIGELYMVLKQMVEKDLEQFGFIVKK